MIVSLGPGGVSMDEHKKKWQIFVTDAGNMFQVKSNTESTDIL